MIWIWLLLQLVWAEKRKSSSMQCFPGYKRWAPWRQGPRWAGRLLHGWQAPRRCPDRSCTAREGAGHCSLLDSQPTRERRDDRLLDREVLSRGLSQSRFPWARHMTVHTNSSSVNCRLPLWHLLSWDLGLVPESANVHFREQKGWVSLVSGHKN